MKNTLHFTFLRTLMILVFGLFFNGVSGQTTLANFKFEDDILPEANAIGNPALTISGQPTYSNGVTGQALTLNANNNSIELSISTQGYSSIQVSWQGRTSNNATPGAWVLTANSGTGYGSTLLSQSLTTTFASSGVTTLGTAFNNNSVVKIKITGSNPSGRNLRIDDLLIRGTSTPTSPPVITSATSITALVGSSINYTITATNTPTSFSTSTLPSGLTFSTPTITGTIANAGVYNFNVIATNAQGSDTKAVTLTVNPASQTISFPAITNKEYGSGTFQLAATASSGLTVSYVSSNTNVATVTNNVVTVVGIGDTNITASQSGDANYTAATSVIRQLTVTKKNLNVTGLTGGTKIYDSTVSATATGTPILDGVISGDIVDLGGSPSYTFLNATVGSNKTINTTGFSIIGSSSSNYQLVQPVLSGSINQKAITVSGATANNKAYDGTLNAVVSGGTLNGVEASDVSNVGISTSGQFATANAGNNILVNVSLTGTSALNYNLTQPNITANITKADQTITFANLPTLNTGSAPINLNLYATVNSSLSLEYTSSNPAVATVSGNTLTVVGSGTTIIIAKQIGDVNHNPAVDVTKNINVVNAPINIAAWDFTGLNQTSTATATLINSNITNGSGILIRGSGAPASTGANSFRTTGFRDNGIAVTNTDYFETSLTVGPNANLSFETIDAKFVGTATFAASPGVESQFAYSINDGNFVLIQIPSTTIGTPATLPQINLSTISALQNLSAGTNVKFRYYASGQTTTGGWGFSSESSGVYGLSFQGYFTVNSTTWNGTSWTNGIPTATVDAIIAANYSTGAVAPQGTFTAKSLTVNSGATLTVATGTTLTVENAIVNNNPNGLGFIVQDNADLVQVTDATNTGDIKVLKKTTPIVRLDHTLWSSPVNGTQSLHDFSPNTLSNRFYTYNTASNAFVSVPQTDTFVTGVGYGIRADNNWGTTPLAWEGTFVGKPNNGPQTFTLSASTTIGYNLVGNPYPSSIDALAFVNTNSAKIERKLYFYSHSVTMQTDGTFLGNNYGIMTVNAAGTSQSYVPADNSSATSNGKIATGQGFFVKALPSATGTINFNNTMRTSAGLFYRSQEIAYEKHSVRLKLTNSEGLFSTLLVNYEGDGTQGVDESDAVAFGTPTFYSLIGTGKYKIQGKGLPFTNSDIVPLGFTAYVSGNHTIELNENSGLFSEQNIYLKDNVTGVIHDIKSGSYTFAANSGTYNNRFEIVYQNSLLGVNNPVFNQNSLVVFKKDGLLNVNATGTTISQIAIYDMSGRILYNNKNVDAENAVINDLVSGHQVLIVKVTSAENAVVTKKVIF